MTAPRNAPIHLATRWSHHEHRIRKPLSENTDTLCYVLSPTGRFVFIAHPCTQSGILVIDLIRNKTMQFQSPNKEGEYVPEAVQFLDDHTIFVAYPGGRSRRNAFKFVRFHVDIGDKACLRKTGEWPNESFARPNQAEFSRLDIPTMHPLMVDASYREKPHFLLHFFDKVTQQIYAVEINAENVVRPDTIWTYVSTDALLSSTTLIADEDCVRLYSIPGFSYPTFLNAEKLVRDMGRSFKQILRLDLVAAKGEIIEAEGGEECLPNLDEYAANPELYWTLSYQWQGGRFYLAYSVFSLFDFDSRPAGSARHYFAVFSAETLRWRRIIIETTQETSPHSFQIQVDDHNNLALFRFKRGLTSITKPLVPCLPLTLLALKFTNFDLCRIPLAKPDSLKLLAQLELQHLYGHPKSKWTKTMKLFGKILI